MFNKMFKNLSSKVLIASPYTMQGNVFHRSIIYLLSHTKDGSTGLIINHSINHMPFGALLKMAMPNRSLMNELNIPIHLGGPVDIEKGMFLHSAEYDKNLLFKFCDNVALSTNSSIINDIAEGNGPKDAMFVVGYTGWSAGQLEFELKNNLWIVADYDYDLLFSTPNDRKWFVALEKTGTDLAIFSSKLGNC